MYWANIDWSNYDTNEIKISVVKLKRALQEKTLTVAQVGNIFKLMRAKSGQQDIDNFQKQAIFNCLTKNDFFTYENSKHVEEDFIAMLYPFKENAFFNCGDIMDTSSLLYCLHDNYTSYNEFSIKTGKNFLLGFGEDKVPERAKHMTLFMLDNTGKIPSVLINNLLFYMFTFESENNLKKCFKEDLNIRRIRNSLMHGRHFYNYNSGYEFYDGINNMEHIATITCAEIMNATNVLVENYISERNSKI